MQNLNAQELFDLLSSLAPYVESPLHMYALGGTALTIRGIKQSTRDIDINFENKQQYTYATKIFSQVGFIQSSTLRWITQEGLAIDVFFGENILGTQLLNDALKKAKKEQVFGNITLYTLAFEDIIISKLARGDERDFDDIKAIFEHAPINLQSLAARYKETMENSVVAHYQQKFIDLIEFKFSEWRKQKDLQLIEEVKKWI